MPPSASRRTRWFTPAVAAPGGLYRAHGAGRRAWVLARRVRLDPNDRGSSVGRTTACGTSASPRGPPLRARRMEPAARPARSDHGARSAGRARGCRSCCRSATSAWPRRRSRSIGARPRSWRWISPPAPVTGLRVQACGDAHVANFGKFATPERSLVFDINDFDETVPGPWEWDVKRLAGSLHVVALDRGFGATTRDEIVTAAVRAYREHMADAARLSTRRPLVRARTHIKDVIAHFPPKYRPAVERDVKKARRKDQRRAIAKLTASDGDDDPLRRGPTAHRAPRARPSTTWTTSRRWSTATGSRCRTRSATCSTATASSTSPGGSSGSAASGTRCWICLFEGPGHPGGDRLILQVKEAQASVLEPYVGASTLAHHGLRVVAGQRLTQAASDIFLGWAEAARSGRQYYVRQLWDAKGSRDPMAMDVSELRYYGALCGMALARAHARTGDPVPIAGYLGRFRRVRSCDRVVGRRVHRHDRRRPRRARARDRDRPRWRHEDERTCPKASPRANATGTMRAWRIHEYGQPEDVLVLDDVPIPAPGSRRGARARAGDPAQPQRSRTHHRRQHDGAPRTAVQPGHGGHGRRRRVRRRRGRVAGRARRRDAEGRARRLRRVRDLPGRLGVRDARRRSRSPTRPRSTSRSTSRGSGCSTAPSCKPARAC